MSPIPDCAAAVATRKFDALVIGGGLAGSSMAILLAKAGRDVLLIEKSAAPHAKVCGEFLSHEALHYLTALGLDVSSLEAVSIEAVRLAGQGIIASAKLPFSSCSLSRERLDEALLQQAASSGVTVARRRRVQTLTKRDASWVAQTDTGETFAGAEAFLATGKHDLYGWNRPAGRQNDLVAFKMYWQLTPAQHEALERHVELVLFPGGYAGLQPVEGGRANLCLLIHKQALKKMAAGWPALVAHMGRHSAHLAARLAGATQLWHNPLSLSSIPYGYVRKGSDGGPWRLGDQSAVIPSFAGDGMSIALHSARLAAAVYLEGNGQQVYQERLAHDVGRQVSRATLLSLALVSPPACRVLSLAVSMWPSVLAYVAGETRLRAERLMR